jgi:hypothetical protein
MICQGVGQDYIRFPSDVRLLDSLLDLHPLDQSPIRQIDLFSEARFCDRQLNRTNSKQECMTRLTECIYTCTGEKGNNFVRIVKATAGKQGF